MRKVQHPDTQASVCLRSDQQSYQSDERTPNTGPRCDADRRHQKQRDQGVDQPISKLIDPAPKSTDDAAYNSVIFDIVTQELEDVFGLEGKDIYGQGLKIYTSIDKPMHDYMNEAIKKDQINYRIMRRSSATAVNTQTGEIRIVDRPTVAP